MNGRRDFLKGVTGAALSGFPLIVPPSVLGRNGHVAPSDKIVFGSIGLGRMGEAHLTRLVEYSDVRVAGVCDPQQAVRERAKATVDRRYGDYACKEHNDFRELLAREDIDAVLIATGERWHPFIVCEAARRAKHIYCEKPLSLSIADAQAVREAVNRHGRVFQFGTQQRSSFFYRQACELIRSGRIGQLKTIMIGSVRGAERRMPPEEPKAPPPGVDWDLWLGPSPWAPYSEQRISHAWLMISDYGLGCPDGAWGIHDVDIAQWVNNSDSTGPIAVEGTGRFFDDIRDAAYEWEVEHTYANGVRLIHMDMATAKKRAREFNSLRSNGASVMFGTEGWIYVSRDGIVTHPESLAREKIGPDGVKVIQSNDQRRDFLNAVRTGRLTIAPVEAAVRDQTVSQQADIAMKLRRRLRWDPVKEEFIDDAEANRRLSRPMRGPWRL